MVINNGLGDDLVQDTYRAIPVGSDFDELVSPRIKKGAGVYQYSSAVDHATHLHKEDFVNFGM